MCTPNRPSACPPGSLRVLLRLPTPEVSPVPPRAHGLGGALWYAMPVPHSNSPWPAPYWKRGALDDRVYRTGFRLALSLATDDGPYGRGGYVLHGLKTFVTSASAADVLVINAVKART